LNLPADVFDDLLDIPQEAELPELRKHARRSVRAIVPLNFLGGTDAGERVIVRDFAPEGMGIRATRDLPVGQRCLVTIKRRNTPLLLLLLCDVRHCRHVAAGVYEAGLQFLDDGGVLRSK